MTVKIDSKIVKYAVLSKEETTPAPVAVVPVAEPEPVQQALGFSLEQMHEALERPEMLLGSTYKVKTPLSEHAMYITINDIVLNPGTPHEQRRPFEVFINSKNMDHFQWIVALTRIISAVFRKGGDVTFLVEELKSVFDPKGGYFKRGGKYMPSLVAEIGDVIESHLRLIGLLKDDGLDEHQQKLVAEKRAQYAARSVSDVAGGTAAGEFPVGATLCNKCQTRAVIVMDGCMTCLNCGDSKCG
ncbi:MAG TPA: NrdJb [Plasticicumulans sp.]|nr:NrdJb [Plasticicumulans sp.]HNE02323.1 NrdJb [Plasticicumulans sp.]